MKKHVLKLMGVLAISATAFGIAPGLMTPPTTEGITNQGSTTEVRVTANVVAGVAVNEGSPIDFGNLVRGEGIYKQGEVVNERTPGWVEYRADNTVAENGVIQTKLSTNTLNLLWQNHNGSDGSGSNETIYHVTVTGIDHTKWEDVVLSSGKAKKNLHAYFTPYVTSQNNDRNETSGNLGKEQKLGSYLGSVIVQATLKQGVL